MGVTIIKPSITVTPISPKFKIINKVNLEPSIIKWDSLFTEKFIEQKKGTAIPGFRLRSKNKHKVIHCLEHCLIIAEAALGSKAVHVLYPDEKNNISYYYENKFTEKIIAWKANQRYVIFGSKKSTNNIIGCLDILNGQLTLIQFEMQPFRVALGGDFWLVGLREDFHQDAEGGLYCFNFDCEFLWGVSFIEEITLPMFGSHKIVPYYLDVPCNGTDIFVRSYWLIYHLDKSGQLINRTSLLDYKEFNEFSYLVGKTLMPNLFVDHTKIKGCVYNHKSKNFFILELDGTISCWDYHGNRIWAKNILLKKKRPCNNWGYYLGIINDKLLAIDKLGNGIWLNFNGRIIRKQNFPCRVNKVTELPYQKSLFVTGETTQGIQGYIVEKNSYKPIPNAKGGSIYSYNGELFYHCYFSFLWRIPGTMKWNPFANVDKITIK